MPHEIVARYFTHPIHRSWSKGGLFGLRGLCYGAEHLTRPGEEQPTLRSMIAQCCQNIVCTVSVRLDRGKFVCDVSAYESLGSQVVAFIRLHCSGDVRNGCVIFYRRVMTNEASSEMSDVSKCTVVSNRTDDPVYLV